MSHIIAAAVTDVGKVREHNEDNHLIDADGRMFVVCDGMGGHAAGEVASRIAVELVQTTWTGDTMAHRIAAYASDRSREAQRKLLHAVRDGVMAAHLEICEQADNDDGKRGMGTTFTGFLVAGGEAVFAHAGDSRAYLVRDGIAMQLSEDHTVLARMRAAGYGEPGEGAEEARWQGVLTNALGIGDKTRVATFLVPLYSGDRFLLCSDGVHEYLTEAEVGEVMLSAPSPARAAQKFVDLALERGGADNATAVVVKVVEADESSMPLEQLERDQEALELCELFAELSPQQRLRAQRITTGRELKPGKTLAPMALGEHVAYVVLEGEVKGPGASYGPGSVIYPGALVEGSELPDRTAQAVAQTDVRVLIIRRDDFLEIVEEESELGVKLYDAVARIFGG